MPRAKKPAAALLLFSTSTGAGVLEIGEWILLRFLTGTRERRMEFDDLRKLLFGLSGLGVR